MNDFITLRTEGMGTAEAYRLICGCVTPRPIAWITTSDSTGRVNAAPFSSYNYVAHSPPMLAVNIGLREGALKDTARNIADSREFVVNVATEANLDLLHACGADYPADCGEPEALGIALVASTLVKPPRIAQTPIQMECRLEQIVPLGRGLNTLYIGEVVAFHFAPEIFDGHYVDTVALRPIARLGGPFYAGMGTIFHRTALQKSPLA